MLAAGRGAPRERAQRLPGPLPADRAHWQASAAKARFNCLTHPHLSSIEHLQDLLPHRGCRRERAASASGATEGRLSRRASQSLLRRARRGWGRLAPFPCGAVLARLFPLRHSPKLWPQPCSASIRRGGARRAVGCSGSASRGDDRAAVHTRVPVDPRVGYPPGNGPTCLSCSAGPPREGRASVRCPFARAREARRGKASTREILSGPTQPASSRIAVPSPIPSGAVLARFAEACNAISDDLARTSVFTRVACRGARARGQV